MYPLSQKGMLLGVGLLVAVLVVNAGISYRQTRQLQDDASWVAHTHEVLNSLEQLLSTLKDAETGQRGFIITGLPAFLEPYVDALEHYQPRLEHVADVTHDNPRQQTRLTQLKGLIATRLDRLAQGIEVRKAQGFDEVLKQFPPGPGRRTMEAVRGVITEMQQEERDLLKSREQINQRTYRAAQLSNVVATALGLTAVCAFVWLLKRHLAALAKSAADIHEQREVLQATLASIGDGVIATDAESRVTFLNSIAQDLTGWKLEDARGKPLQQVFHIVNEATRKPADNPALRALQDGKVVGLANHTILISKHGAEWPLDDSAAPIIGAAGNIIGAILVFREISDRKRQETELRLQTAALSDANHRKGELVAELAEADRRKDEFLAILAHELRNPLAPLSNALQLWPAVENDRSEMEQLRELMERQVRQMTRLIDDLLDVSRITRGKIQLRKQRIDIGVLINGAVESIQPMLDACCHKLTLSLSVEPVFVDGDVSRLTQVFGNILQNAAKYTGRNGVIWVAAEQLGDRAVVTIRDNGPGIPQHMLSQIFAMFQQVDQTLHRSHGGLGIGLTLVKRLVDLHGGTVEARSEGPGKGSDFIVTLPALPAEAKVDGNVGSVHALHQISSVPRHRILVVDDVQASAKTLAMMLRAIGQDVDFVNDGPTAIEWITVHQPDVVFLDIAMPGMDGYEVARRIRRQSAIKETLLVALTGYGQEEDRRRASEAGFNQHLTKPTSIDALQQLLSTLPDPLCRRASQK